MIESCPQQYKDFLFKPSDELAETLSQNYPHVPDEIVNDAFCVENGELFYSQTLLSVAEDDHLKLGPAGFWRQNLRDILQEKLDQEKPTAMKDKDIHWYDFWFDNPLSGALTSYVSAITIFGVAAPLASDLFKYSLMKITPLQNMWKNVHRFIAYRNLLRKHPECAQLPGVNRKSAISSLLGLFTFSGIKTLGTVGLLYSVGLLSSGSSSPSKGDVVKRNQNKSLLELSLELAELDNEVKTLNEENSLLDTVWITLMNGAALYNGFSHGTYLGHLLVQTVSPWHQGAQDFDEEMNNVSNALLAQCKGELSESQAEGVAENYAVTAGDPVTFSPTIEERLQQQLDIFDPPLKGGVLFLFPLVPAGISADIASLSAGSTFLPEASPVLVF